MGDPTPTPTPTAEAVEIERLRAESATQQRQLALAQARLDFPQADGEILSSFEGTVDGLRAFAEKLQAKELERQEAIRAAQPTPPPAPTPGPGGGSSPEEAEMVRYRELKSKVLGRYAEPYERDEFEKLEFRMRWNQHMADRKAGVRA